MSSNQSSIDKQRVEQLKGCLQVLSRDCGVWREDLIALLRSPKLSALQGLWSVNVNNNDLKIARRAIAANLIACVERWRPRHKNRTVEDLSIIDRNRRVAMVGFNIGPERELRSLILSERWDCLAGASRASFKFKEELQVAVRTSRRVFAYAIEQLAEHLAGDEQKSLETGGASDDLFTKRAPIFEPTAPSNPLIRPALSPRGLTTNLLVLSGEVSQALDAVRNGCRDANRPFYTSDTLLALLDMPNMRVQNCFNYDEINRAQPIRQKLASVPAGKDGRFVEFEWIERDEFQLALEYAAVDGAPVVNEFHLLLAIFDDASVTNQSLKGFLKQDHAKVREAAERGRRDGPEKIKTPAWD